MSDQEKVFKHIDGLIERTAQGLRDKQNGNPLTKEQEEKLSKLREDLRAEISKFFILLNS